MENPLAALIPTFQICYYGKLQPHTGTAANRPGYGHIAFEVDDVLAAHRVVEANGGGEVGEIITSPTKAGTRVTWCYMTDPEGNIIELQSWA